MRQFLRKLFSRDRRNPFPDSKQVIEFAFECGGIRYYRHVDEMNMPYRRALKALTIYKELDMKCDRHYLDQHIEAMDAILEGTRFNVESLLKIKTLTAQLRERVQWIIVPDHVYKLASVRYFDETENPNDYDWKYAAQKIAHWKKHEGVNDFFLREPIATLIPFLKDAPLDFESFSRQVDELTRSQLDVILSMLPRPQRIASYGSTEALFSEEIQHESQP